MEPMFPANDEKVRLIRDIPELSLRRGDVGLARRVWKTPSPVYEVEFQLNDGRGSTRSILLFSNQVEPIAAFSMARPNSHLDYM
jgi:hypothetical protein